MTAPLTAWLAACLVAFALASAHLLDGPTDHSTDVAQAQALDDAYQADQARQRFEHAAQALCGPNAAWRPTAASGEVQCLTKHGRKTITAQVQP